MATKKCDVLVKVVANPVQPINVWIDKPTEAATEIMSIEGVTACEVSVNGPLYIMVDPRYDAQEVAGEIRMLLTAEVPDIFKE